MVYLLFLFGKNVQLLPFFNILRATPKGNKINIIIIIAIIIKIIKIKIIIIIIIIIIIMKAELERLDRARSKEGDS